MNQSQVRTTLTGCDRLSLVGLLMLFVFAVADGQTPSWSATTGTTPASMAPGAPAGSYSLSGFESINLFNRRLNFDLPLLHVGGRGAAGYTVQLPLGFQWQEYNYSYA